jgi:hypothetical protein
MQLPPTLSAKLTDLVSTGPRPWLTPKTSSRSAKGANILQNSSTYQLKPWRTIPTSWHFAMWGLDLDSIGLFRTAPGGYKHILVAIDIFTTWIEVRPIAKVTSEEAAKFIKEITHCFGVPNRIITGLGTAFTGSVFWDFCQDNTIDVYYSSVAHPRFNGQVERANGMVL